MRFISSLVSLVFFMGISEIALSQEQSSGATPQQEKGGSFAPEVRIVPKKKMIIEEYRVNGRLHMIKIIPSIGPPYYLIDTDGDGELETRRDDLESPKINQWLLFSWEWPF